MHRLRGAATIALLAIVAGCGSDAAGPKVGPPAQMDLVSTPSDSAAAGGAGGTFAVRVRDAAGAAVSGVRVTFSASGAATVSPGEATTDASGIASTHATLSPGSGPGSVSAAVPGTGLGVAVEFLVLPRPLDKLVLTPDPLLLKGVNDTARLVASGTDAIGNRVQLVSPTFTSLDTTVATVDSRGLVRALLAQGSTRVVGASSGHADTVTVTIGTAPVACTSGSARGMALGEFATFTPTDAPCLSGTIAGAEFGLVAWNGDTVNAASLSVRGEGLGTPLLAGMQRTSTVVPSSRLDVDFHAALLERTRTLARLIPAARQWRAARATAQAGGFTPRPNYAVISATVQVGDLLRFNVNGYSPCDSPTYRDARVVAVSRSAVVLADTLNPAGGFTAADYANVASRFDTLVYPLDSAAFGAATDIDGNGRVGILFTSYVNSLTPRGSNSYVGGYFFGRDLFPKAGTPSLPACAGSNEGEMFYMLAPDPNGTVSDARGTSFVLSISTATIAHELQHLINTSRRIFVSTTARDFEDVWLDEGLSHVAEELLFYRESGLTPRRNLGDAEVRASSGIYAAFNSDQRQNALRYDAYLESPKSNGPVADNDDLTTRGAAWSFLRFAADHQFAQDGDLWYRLVNSGTSGLATLRSAYPSEPLSLMRDWAVSNLVDDAGFATDARFQQPSWNHRDLFTHMSGIARYPLAVVALGDSSTASAVVAGTTAAYFRFAIPAGSQARLTFGTPGGTSSGALQFVVVRTR